MRSYGPLLIILYNFLGLMPGVLMAACYVDGSVEDLGMMGTGDFERILANRFI
jgi:hypothetical protein